MKDSVGNVKINKKKGILKMKTVTEKSKMKTIRTNGLRLAIVAIALVSFATLAVPENLSSGAALPWSQFALVETLPGMQAIEKLNDGEPNTRGIWCTGGEGGGEIAIRFPSALEITQFRFVQWGGGATKYRLTADLDGKGDFSTVIQEKTDPKAVTGKFIAIPVNRKVYGLKLTALEGAASYRAPFPILGEIEIYSKTAVKLPVFPGMAAAAELKPGAAEPLPAFKRKDIDIRICIDTWHAGIPRAADAVNLENNKTFLSMLKRFQEADANSARLFIETACCDNEMPWKSEKLWPGHGFDQLAPLVRALHKNGLKLYFFSHAWMSPFQKRGERAKMPYCRWDYPYMQSDRIVGIMEQYKVTYPCLISDPEFRDKWLEFLGEALDQGVDGVYLMPDEYSFKGHNLSRVDCPLCTAAFKKMYGYDSLPKAGGISASKVGNTTVVSRGSTKDSEQYRKWKLFEYQKIADLFHSISAELRKHHPQAQIVMSDNKILEDLAGRPEHNISLDIIENDPNADFSQMYGNAILDKVGWISAYTRRIAAAAGQDKLLASIQWLGVQYTNPNYPIQLYGYALPQIMLGAKVYENYRLNYMYDKGWWPNVIECHKMIRLLEQWGVGEAKTPDVACLIESRASEDWWRTKLEGMCGEAVGGDVAFNLLYAGDDINKSMDKAEGSDRDRMLKLDALRGVGSKLAMESLLCENGVPYQVAFADRIDNLQNLKRFKLLIMPFCYSLSQEAFAKISEAVEAGTTLVVFGPMAPTDEFGNPYPEPLLKSLIGKPNVVYVADNLAAVGNSAVKRAEYTQLLAPILEPCGYAFDAKGQPVECIVRCLPKQEGFIVYLGNWNTTKDELDKLVISLPFEDAKYKAEVYSSATKTLNDLDLAGKPGAFDGKALKTFSLDLASSEVKLLHIYKERK